MNIYGTTSNKEAAATLLSALEEMVITEDRKYFHLTADIFDYHRTILESWEEHKAMNDARSKVVWNEEGLDKYDATLVMLQICYLGADKKLAKFGS